MNHKVSKHSFCFANPPVINAWSSVAGIKESQGPLAHSFDYTLNEPYFGEKTWEQAEQKMQKKAMDILLDKSHLQQGDLDVILSGDLLNQCIGSSFPFRNTNVAHLGLYGACSTMAEGLLVGSMAIGGGFCTRAAVLTSSHFASSERQYRFPLGYGGQRTPTAQWTVTGSGAVLLSTNGSGPKITKCTIGTIQDLGVTDPNNMGAAMAPAALHTILTHFNDFSVSANDFDYIITGDLGRTGKELLLALAIQEGISLAGKLLDCGTMIFDTEKQDVHSGGSGCGCSAVTLCAYFLPKLAAKRIGRILFCGTGALLSPTSSQQSLPIPGICHAVCIEGR